MLSLKMLEQALEASELTLSLLPRERELSEEACDEIDPRRGSLSALDGVMGALSPDQLGAHLSSRRGGLFGGEPVSPSRSW